MGKVLGENALGGAGNKNEREVGIALDYMPKLRDEMLADASSA